MDRNCCPVEEANEDTGLQVGDQILALDGRDLDQIASLHKAYLSARLPERHYRMGRFGLCVNECHLLEKDRKDH